MPLSSRGMHGASLTRTPRSLDIFEERCISSLRSVPATPENGGHHESIVLDREALQLELPGRLESLENLARCHRIRFTQLGEVEDREQLFGFYAGLEYITQTMSSDDLSAAKAWVNVAEDFHHPTTLFAYETALDYSFNILLLSHHYLNILMSSSPSSPRSLWTHSQLVFVINLLPGQSSRLNSICGVTEEPGENLFLVVPTAEFTLLRLHAAGPYRKGQQNVSDLFISSYTP